MHWFGQIAPEFKGSFGDLTWGRYGGQYLQIGEGRSSLMWKLDVKLHIRITKSNLTAFLSDNETFNLFQKIFKKRLLCLHGFIQRSLDVGYPVNCLLGRGHF